MNNIKIQKLAHEDVYWINLFQDRPQGHVFVNMVMNLGVPRKQGMS
jgi:hypothetical protein